MAKQKKVTHKQGAAKKTVKPADANVHSDKETKIRGGIIGIGIPVDEETMKKMKEQAKKLEQ